MSARRPAPRPKRAAETFARTHHLDTEDGPSKKPRFDVRNPSALAPDAREEDAILELDEIGKGGQGTKRNAVNLDGYDSDSSNEGFDARGDAKGSRPKKGVVGGEEEDDMFADLEEEFKDGDDEVDRAAGSKKKDVRFLDEEEIVGQVAGSKAGGHVSADFSLGSNGKGKDTTYSSSSEEEDPANEEVDEEVGAGGKKKHAPKLDAFNMKNELEEGRFDANGNFVRKAADPDAVHDSWLDGVSKKDMKRASEAAKKREEERKQKMLEDDQLLMADVLKGLVVRLEKGETVLEALARLGRGKEKKKPKWQKNRNKKKDSGMDVDATKDPEDPAETRRREAVEAITEAADILFTRGQTEIYEDSREMLVRQYRRETGEDWVEPPKAAVAAEAENGEAETKQWEYKWTDGRDGGETYGPFEGSAMSAWQDAGFFGEGVEFRRAGEQGGWTRVADFV